jgi:SAM-dependent methyltransferase
MPLKPSESSAIAEETRIRSAYTRRPKDDRYSWFSPGHLFLMQEREKLVLRTLQREGLAPLDGKTILEIGCGTGHWLREFIKWGAQPRNITGIDLLPERVVQARALCPAGVTVECHNAAELTLPDEAFDLVVQSTVFTSIQDPESRKRVASQMLRVLKEDGVILWYDFHVNNARNPDVRAVTHRELGELFPRCRIRVKRLTLAPPLLRQVARYSWLLSHLLSGIPWLCTHHLATIRKR